jgi:tetratricopeptide (TPR) repeat protein
MSTTQRNNGSVSIELLMTSENEADAFDRIWRKFEANNVSQALQELRELTSRVDDPWDIAWLNCQEIRFLVDMHNTHEARQRLEDLKRKLASLVTFDSPSDSSELDPNVTLPMLARHAEIRVTTEEGREIEALQLIENFVACYPKQLSLPEYRALAEEVAILRGFLLANVGRWEAARAVLEDVAPPQAWKGQYCHYLGRCYYEAKEYERARSKLVEALNLGLDTLTEGRTHYVLGIVEYHLSDIKAAKHQFELSVKTANQAYLGEPIWEWLEATSRALGLQCEAENYRKMRIDSPAMSPLN